MDLTPYLLVCETLNIKVLLAYLCFFGSFQLITAPNTTPIAIQVGSFVAKKLLHQLPIQPPAFFSLLVVAFIF